MRHAWVALMVLVLSPLGPPTAASASDFWEEVKTPGLRIHRREIERAELALRARRYEDALSAADAAIALVEGAPRAHVLRALSLGELRRMDEAMAELRVALEIDARCLDEIATGRRAAELATVAGDYEMAAHVLERVLGHMSRGRMRRTLYALYGDVLSSIGPTRLRDSVAAYREALRGRSGSHERAALGLALALARSGEEVESTSLLREIADSSNLESLIRAMAVPEGERDARRALIAEHRQRRDDAIAGWERALASEPWREATEAHLRALRSGP